MRLPRGVIKTDYLAQPKAGMCTIPITDATLFVDGVIRKCSTGEFDLTSAYDVRFHCRKMRKLTYDKSIACGFIGIMDTSQPYERTSFKKDAFDLSDDESSADDSDTSHDAKVGEPPDAEVIEAMAKQIASSVIKEARQKQSDFYGLKFEFSNLVSCVRICMNFFHSMVESVYYNDVDFSFDDEVRVIAYAIRRLFVYQKGNSIRTDSVRSLIQNQVDTARILIPNILEQLTYVESTYDLSSLNFGIDFGLTHPRGGIMADDFETFVEQLVNDRHAETGLKMYYPDKFFYDIESDEASRLARPSNYIDFAKTQKDSAQKWLFYEVKDFIEFCKKQNVKPVGILPWKLFDVCAMPMYKDPAFLTKMSPMIRDTINIIDEIMAVDDPLKRKEILDSYYSPPAPKRAPVSRAKIPEPAVEKTTFNLDTINAFGDMDDYDLS